MVFFDIFLHACGFQDKVFFSLALTVLRNVFVFCFVVFFFDDNERLKGSKSY